MSSPSCVVFPSFNVTDSSWGPVWLNISDVCGILIESKETGHILESWRWNETSHITIKKMSTLLVQLKKFNGAKKLISFSSIRDLERFERVLNNAVPILTVSNMKRQRKLVIIQAPAIARSNKICLPKAVPKLVTDVNSNVQESGGASVIPPPPPPPPPMVSQPKLCKVQVVKPKKQVVRTNFAYDEMQKVFANGMIKPSAVISAAKSGLSAALMMDKNIPSTDNPSIPMEESEKPEGSQEM